MTKLEQVIYGLDCCSWGIKCSFCPYKDEPECRTVLMCDALELLKNKTCHVMTLEELHDDTIETVYYESKRGAFLECKKEWGVISYNVLCLIDKYNKNILRDCNTYGVLWRCWTSKPSEQQRKNTPWNDYAHFRRNK